MQHLHTLIALVLLPFYSFSQTNTVKHKKMSMLAFTVENDLFLPAHTDRYYTNGFEIGYFREKSTFKNRIASILGETKGQNVFGISISAQMYTPLLPPLLSYNLSRQITFPQVDRPYAGLLTLNIKQEVNAPSVSTRITTVYSLGILGPAAQQHEVQHFFHKMLKRPLHNWDNQIPNDMAINVNFKMDKRILRPSPCSDIIGFIAVNAGTVSNALKMGSLVKLGIFKDYFQGSLKQAQELSLFFSPHICFFYDQALLEGGFSTRSKQEFLYTIPREQMKHFYYEMQFGASVNIKKVKIIYVQNMRSPEFKTALNTYWGSISILTSMHKD